jgi:hypothetical protein
MGSDTFYTIPSIRNNDSFGLKQMLSGLSIYPFQQDQGEVVVPFGAADK